MSVTIGRRGRVGARHLNFTLEFERVCISEAVPSMREWSITTYTGGYTYP